MVKLNFKRIQELENEYNAKGHNISHNTLQRMIDIIMTPRDPGGWTNQSAYLLATNTLLELGILEQPKTKKDTQQLNS